MRFSLAPSLFLLLPLAGACFAPAQTPPTPASPAAAHIVFTFDHPQLQPAHYSITVDETGVAQYSSQPGPATDASDGIFPSPLDRPLRVDDALRADLFTYAAGHSDFATHCASAQTNLAFTGNKTLAYTGPQGNGSCTFVWAGDPALARLVDQLSAVAFTLEEGRRLDLEDRHDRLALDSELESLQDAFKDHRASDLSNIADQLQLIVSDQQVMDRARKRAAALLSHCQPLPRPN